MEEKKTKPLKISAMVPARTGSKRVKSKNLRKLGEKPLISHVLDTITGLEIFDTIHLNSDGEVFGEIAANHNVEFYLRKKSLANDTATNDEFAYDFLKNVECDILIQVLPTSPFLLKEEIEAFTNLIISNSLDGLISVEEKKIACVYEGKAINFSKNKKNPPSQTMTPVLAYATALMGWNTKKYIQNFEKYGVAYHCPEGKVEYFPLSGLSTIDIDNEKDFRLAEAIFKSRAHFSEGKVEYYEKRLGE